jgi:aspartyl-tRNA synthetase
MSSVEELTTAIANKGAEIKAIKDAKPPTLKEDLAPLIKELLALKVSYKEVSGQDFDPPKKAKAPKQATEKKSDGPSKTELNKAKKKAQKEALRAAEAAAKGGEKETQKATSTAKIADSTEDNTALYGDLPLITSAVMTEKIYKDIDELSEDMAGFKVWVRARVHSTRAVGKGCFLVLRQRMESLQAVMFQGPEVSKNMVKYATSLSNESIIDVLAEITIPENPILSTTIRHLELKVVEVHAVSRAEALPFQVEDAGRSEEVARSEGLPVVNQDTALNYRWIDTRTQASQAIFRINHGVCALFREYFTNKGFTEIHTPKLIYGASEGGSSVFNLKYFETPACLAQSPQLYKQMVSANGGFEKVFEIGPVFRAENSNTHRHLCEFTGCDFEMAIREHYYEVLQVCTRVLTQVSLCLNVIKLCLIWPCCVMFGAGGVVYSCLF